MAEVVVAEQIHTQQHENSLLMGTPYTSLD